MMYLSSVIAFVFSYFCEFDNFQPFYLVYKIEEAIFFSGVSKW